MVFGDFLFDFAFFGMSKPISSRLPLEYAVLRLRDPSPRRRERGIIAMVRPSPLRGQLQSPGRASANQSFPKRERR